MNSKKLLVLSDTHGHLAAVKAVLNWAKDRLPPDDTICGAAFLGDGISDLRPAAEATGFYCEWKLVRGNNDYGYSIPEAAVMDFAEHHFFLCHGHRYNLYGAGYNNLIAAARNAQADVVLFGHSHAPFQKNVDGILLVNPGSAGSPRSRIGATFAVIECLPDDSLVTEFWGIGNRGEIRKVKI
jgi:putative phosphoesterase